jgi:hypothetical protein
MARQSPPILSAKFRKKYTSKGKKYIVGKKYIKNLSLHNNQISFQSQWLPQVMEADETHIK